MNTCTGGKAYDHEEALPRGHLRHPHGGPPHLHPGGRQRDPTTPTAARPTPVTIHWPDGRSWQVESIYFRSEFGRALFDNLCVRYDVCIAKQRKTVWWEHGDWFVERGSGMAVTPA